MLSLMPALTRNTSTVKCCKPPLRAGDGIEPARLRSWRGRSDRPCEWTPALLGDEQRVRLLGDEADRHELVHVEVAGSRCTSGNATNTEPPARNSV